MRSTRFITLFATGAVLFVGAMSGCGPSKSAQAKMTAAVRANDFPEIGSLIRRDPRLRNIGDGGPPLVLAATLGHEESVETLLSGGADPNAAADGDTALMRAIRSGRRSMIDKLLEAGADVNARGVKGLTALHFAAEADNDELVRDLIKKGAKIDAASDDGDTPLHKAAAKAPNAARLLLARGADPEAMNASGRTPTAVAADTMSGVRYVFEARRSGPQQLGDGVTPPVMPLTVGSPVDYTDRITILSTRESDVVGGQAGFWETQAQIRFRNASLTPMGKSTFYVALTWRGRNIQTIECTARATEPGEENVAVGLIAFSDGYGALTETPSVELGKINHEELRFVVTLVEAGATEFYEPVAIPDKDL